MITKFPNMIVIATKIGQHICAFELQYIMQSSFTPYSTWAWQRRHVAHKTRNACVNIVCIARWQHVTAKFAGCTQRVHTVAVCKWRVAGPGRRSICSLSGFI